jgi:glycosyltransferase involved in cell wall biosynthesis
MTKVLLHTNSPTSFTGYGVQAALLVDRLVEDGYDVAVSATYGHPGGNGMGTYTTRSGVKVKLYPNWQSVSGEDVLYAHAQSHFAGGDGWIICLLDIWSLTGHGAAAFNMIAWAPVDHHPVPPIVTDFFERAPSVVPLAMSQHGQSEYQRCGIDAGYIPLAVDTNVYKPTFEMEVDGRTVTSREFLGLPDGAFVVGCVGMSKDPADRKNFGIAIQAFAEFHKTHPNAILHIHTDKHGGLSGNDLVELVAACGLPDGAVTFTNQYAYIVGFPPKLMALMYTGFDVLLQPSAGEGFGVPLVEAQACGVPVIVSDWTAQSELCGAGWTVTGDRVWDGPNKSWYLRPHISQVVEALEKAYDADLINMQDEARAFAVQYDADHVYETYWRPYLAKVTDTRPPADKEPMSTVAVLVPAMKRPENVQRLTESFNESNDGTATLYYICDVDDLEQIAAVEAAGVEWIEATRGTSFAAKINEGYLNTSESWIFVTGDDVEFTPGWIEAARELSDRYDVIGTNDSEPGRVRNPKVAAGTHSDHFFVRRDYIDNEGASLEGPGIVLAEAYFHFYTDVETIQLAKALGRFTPCLDSHVIHHHPGYDGREDLRQADPVYMHAVEFSETDATAFKRRAGLIDQRKTVTKDIWT